MKTVTRDQVARVVGAAIPGLAFDLPADVRAGLERAFERETGPRAREVLRLLCENAQVAHDDRVPLCQDTGSVWVCLEAGPDVAVAGDALAGVNAAVGAAYTEHRLRKSIVRDAVSDRTNTGDNTPAFCEVRLVEKPGARIHIMLKGGGSDNASRLAMLTPGSGLDGVERMLLEVVRAKAANACPPLIVGVGIGGTFDKVAGLAKRALMRPLDQPAETPELRALEERFTAAVNATGIGAGALGGDTTALGVRVLTAPCHIAALPVAVNMGCSAMRRGTYELTW